MQKFTRHELDALSKPRTALPSCLLIVGFFSLAMWQQQPVHATTDTTTPSAQKVKTATATVYFVAPETGTLVKAQILHAGDALQVPAGYNLLAPEVAANIQTTLASGYSTSITLKIGRQVTATMRYVDASNQVIASTTLSGTSGTHQSYTPTAPAGYQLTDTSTHQVTFASDDRDDLTFHVSKIQPATTPAVTSKPATTPKAATQPVVKQPATKTEATPTTTTSQPAAAQLTIHYVVDTGSVERKLRTDTITGKVGDHGHYTAAIPTGYALAAKQSQQVAYTLTATKQTLLVHLIPQTAVATAQPSQVALATVVVISDATGQIIVTKAIFGRTGERIVFDTNSILGPLLAGGARVVQDGTKHTAAFTGSVQRFEIHILPAAKRAADPFARTEAVPYTTQPQTTTNDDQQTDPKHHTLAASDPTTTGHSGFNRDQMPPVIVTHSRLLPQDITNDGGDPHAASGLAAYFVALSGKINFGVRQVARS